MITSSIMEVTPEIAQGWWNNTNSKNRGFKTKYAKGLAAIMQNGGWDLNGESIIIDVNGNIVNGQHRTWAIIYSGVTIKSLVVKGVPHECFSTMDSGMKRSIPDVLEIAGFTKSQSNVYGTAAKHELFQRTTGRPAVRGADSTITKAINNQVVLEEVATNLKLQELGDVIMSYPRKVLPMSPTSLTFLLYRFCLFNEEFSIPWINGFITGIGLGELDTRLWVRSKFYRDSRSTSSLSSGDKMAFVIKAWYTAIVGKKLKSDRSLFNNPYQNFMLIRHSNDQHVKNLLRDNIRINLLG